MNSNFQPSLWNEVKSPLMVVCALAVIMVGLHNTFYTYLSVDHKLFSVHWADSGTMKKETRSVSALVERVEVEKTHQVVGAKVYGDESGETLNVVDEVSTSAKENEYVVIDGDINVSAAEFYHPKLSSAVSGSLVSGYLEVEGGQIKGISVQLNSDTTKVVGAQMIVIGEAELQGNIFTYEIDGESYTGTVYPTNANEYMVSFVNGPWMGARVKFNEAAASESAIDEAVPANYANENEKGIDEASGEEVAMEESAIEDGESDIVGKFPASEF